MLARRGSAKRSQSTAKKCQALPSASAAVVRNASAGSTSRGAASPAIQFRYRPAKPRAGFLSQAKQVGENVPPDHGAWYWVYTGAVVFQKDVIYDPFG